MKGDIKYVGVDDLEIDLFEGQYPVENGMSYNSYLIIDKKIAVMDSVEIRFQDTWLKNIEDNLDGRTPDYLVVLHMEPDHSGNIENFIKKYPNAKIILNSKTYMLLNQFFDYDFEDKVIIVKDNETISLGNHSLKFFFAPMVHWPEVMMVYDEYAKALFSADGFGKFGSFAAKEDWLDEARRYYFGIIGKYGIQVSNIISKIYDLDIKTIYSLHGPILDKDISYYIEKYKLWASYEAEDKDGIFIAYTSIYGNTKEAVNKLAKRLNELGNNKVVVSDLARSDMSKNLENAFRYGKMVLATTTYNNELFPFMSDFITRIKEHGYQNREIFIIENGSWAPQVEKRIKEAFAQSKNVVICDHSVHIKSSVKQVNENEIEVLAQKIIGERR